MYIKHPFCKWEKQVRERLSDLPSDERESGIQITIKPICSPRPCQAIATLLNGCALNPKALLGCHRGCIFAVAELAYFWPSFRWQKEGHLSPGGETWGSRRKKRHGQKNRAHAHLLPFSSPVEQKAWSSSSSLGPLRNARARNIESSYPGPEKQAPHILYHLRLLAPDVSVVLTPRQGDSSLQQTKTIAQNKANQNAEPWSPAPMTSSTKHSHP